MNAMLKILSWLLVCYTAYCVFLFFMRRQILFPRSLIPSPPQPEGGLPGIEEIWLDTPSGKVEAWFLPADRKHSSRPAPAVVFGHGNGELIDYWPQSFKRFTEIGIGLLLVELLTGRRAHAEQSPIDLITRLQSEDLTPELVCRVEPAYQDLLLPMLANNAARRPSMSEVARRVIARA